MISFIELKLDEEGVFCSQSQYLHGFMVIYIDLHTVIGGCMVESKRLSFLCFLQNLMQVVSFGFLGVNIIVIRI